MRNIIIEIESSLRSLIKGCGGNDYIQSNTLNVDINTLLNQVEQDVYDILRVCGVPYIGPLTFMTQPSSNFANYLEDNSITPEQLSLFSKEQLEELTDQQLISLTVQSLSEDLISTLTAEQLNSFTHKQILAFSISQRNAINKNQQLDPIILNIINSRQPSSSIEQLTNLQLKLWFPEQFRKLTKIQLNNITISSLSPKLVSSLTPEQLKSLNSYQVSLLQQDYLTPQQRMSISQVLLNNRETNSNKLSYTTDNIPS